MKTPEIYTYVHKGLRSLVSQFLYEAGSTDWTDASAVDRVQGKWQIALRLLHSHHHSESDFIHPLLAKVVPGGHRTFEAEHNAQAIVLDDLDAHLRRLSSGQHSAEKQQEVGLEFYLGVAAFYGEYILHLHREEEWAQRAMKDMSAPEEVRAALGQLLASMPLEEANLYLPYMIPAMNLPDCESFMYEVKAVAPEMFSFLTDMMRQHRSAEDWAMLESRVGIQVSD